MSDHRNAVEAVAASELTGRRTSEPAALAAPAPALEALLRPRSIAIVGISARQGPGSVVLENLRSFGFRGAIHLVNPKYPELHGLPSVSSLAEVSDPIDCVVVVTGAETAVTVVEEAAGLGVPAAIVLAAGFAESDKAGAELQTKLTEIARASGMAMAGPNGLGIVNLADGVVQFGAPVQRELASGAIAAVLQSGSVALALANPARELAFAYLISSGNEAVVDTATYLNVMLNDDRVGLVMVFMEGVPEPSRFVEAAALALELRKPIVALKVGRSESGRRATLAHTASLAGSDRAFDAVCRRYGIVRVADLDQLIETTKLLATLVNRLPQKGGLGLLTLSGGEGALVLDIASELGLSLPTLAPRTLDALRAALPSFVSSGTGNPFDGTHAAVFDLPALTACVRILAEDPEIGLVGFVEDGNQGRVSTRRAAQAIAEVAPTLPKPLVWCTTASRGTDGQVQEALHAAGVPMLYGLRESLTALRGLLGYARTLDAEAQSRPTVFADRAARARALLVGGSEPLLTFECQELLDLYGIRTVPQGLATSIEEATEIAERVGYPVAVKLSALDLIHKTEANALRLNVVSRTEVQRVIEELGAVAAHLELGTPTYLVQQMVIGIELHAGIAHDEQFGPMITTGIGGIFVEALDDVAVLPVPIGRGEADWMVSHLRSQQLLDGFRGKPPVNREALSSLLLGLSALAAECRELVTDIDLNPIIATDEGLFVVDALAVRRGGGSFGSDQVISSLPPEKGSP